MRISRAWVIAAKDMKVFWRKKYALYSLVLFPLIVSFGLPLMLHLTGSKAGALRASILPVLMNSFSFFYLVGAASLPSVLASYSIVGEKIEKSLEPLLAAPVTDAELLFGKSIAAFIPPVAALYLSSICFMFLSNLVTRDTLGYAYFPNWTIGKILLLLAPLSATLSIEWSVIVSSKASDPRAAQMQGLFIVLPLTGVYIASEVGAITLTSGTLWIISGILLIADAILFFLATKTFQREEILTKWTS